jgi:magnesium-transporting ATPase (P-type)
MEDDLFMPSPQGVPVSDKLTPMIISIFISIFAVQFLYIYSDQQILWIALFSIFLLIMLAAKSFVKTSYFRKEELNDVDARTLLSFFSLTQIVLAIITKLALDLTGFIAAINVMQWHAYVNTGALLLCFVLAIMAQVQIPV